MKAFLLVMLGSGLGGGLRYLVSRLFATFFVAAFPYATFSVNILGCLLIGLFSGWYSRGVIDNADIKLMLTVGFCGGFTTFSSFINEGYILNSAGDIKTMFIYGAVSLVLGYAALLLGYLISK